MLVIEQMDVHYGIIQAIKGISITVNYGEVVSLIGANGAGKTTILRTISGLAKQSGGSITFEGDDITKMAASKRVEAGISHAPEGRRVFPGMSVYENLELGAYLSKDKAKTKKSIEMVFGKFPRLAQREKQMAGTLSGGEQQMLAIGRALMLDPKILLLDEPSMGLAPLLVKEIFNTIKEINSSGTTILLVEQNASQALALADRAYVLETGKIVLSGKGEELLKSDEVRKAYLGG
ncbi:MAG: ABC transporter ATP-binding protein [Eubacteriaceae bacterium]|nr:ABC transporter ATP-binding protein [Eubacteriaceae bacterium]